MAKLLTSKKARTTKAADTFKSELTKLSDAAIGVILIRTREPYRCQEALYDWSLEQEKDFKVWNILAGWQSFARPNDVMHGPNGKGIEVDVSIPTSNDIKTIPISAALKAIRTTFPDKGCYVLMNAHHFLEAPDVQQYIKQMVQDALNDDRRTLIIVPEFVNIPQGIEDDVCLLEFKPPSHQELKAIWLDHKENLDATALTHIKPDQVDLLVQNAIGMTALEFDTALSIALVQNRDRLMPKSKNPVTVKDIIDVVMRTKVDVIKKTDILELMPSADMKEVGGLELLKEWLKMRSSAFSEEAKKFGVDQPKGMLVVGPPGCGKSLAAKATASVLNIPCLKLDIGRVFGQYIGQSESRMRQTLQLVEGMAPCVLLIDEVDKALGGIGGGGDSGTSSRVLGTLLTWLQEHNNEQSPIFIIMTANNITGLPPELMRRGRMDEIFAVNFPNHLERKQILQIHTEKRGHKLTDAEYSQIASASKEFVGAELEAIVKDGITACFYSNGKKLKVEHVLAEAKGIVPLSKAFAEQVKAMNVWAKNNAKPASAHIPDPEDVLTSNNRMRGSSGIRKRRVRNLTDN